MPTHTQTQTQNRWFSGENQRGGPLKTRIVAIFQIRKSTENPEISKIGRKKCSHVPMFPEIFQKTSPAGRWADRPGPINPPARRGSEHLRFGIRQSLLQISRKDQRGKPLRSAPCKRYFCNAHSDSDSDSESLVFGSVVIGHQGTMPASRR